MLPVIGLALTGIVSLGGVQTVRWRQQPRIPLVAHLAEQQKVDEPALPSAELLPDPPGLAKQCKARTRKQTRPHPRQRANCSLAALPWGRPAPARSSFTL